MKECPVCKAENTDGAKFCSSCAAPLNPGSTQETSTTETHNTIIQSSPASKEESAARSVFRFSSHDEKFLASIGNGFIQNFLAGGKVSQTMAALTDKRLYYHGRTLTGNGLKLSNMTEEGSVMVKDITYTGFTHSDPKWMKIVGIILTVLGGYLMLGTFKILIADGAPFDIFLIFALFSACFLVPGIRLLINYARKKTSIFLVRFAGGGLAFDVNLYPVDESRRFQDALNRAIDAQK